jgi:hypothetical protein
MNDLPLSAVRPGDKPGEAHRRAYPGQYTHPLVGKYVKVVIGGSVKHDGIVERVVSTRFGLLAHFEDTEAAWRVTDCVVIV